MQSRLYLWTVVFAPVRFASCHSFRLHLLFACYSASATTRTSWVESIREAIALTQATTCLKYFGTLAVKWFPSTSKPTVSFRWELAIKCFLNTCARSNRAQMRCFFPRCFLFLWNINDLWSDFRRFFRCCRFFYELRGFQWHETKHTFKTFSLFTIVK